jgi:uncharacterized membrane protein (UPF0127 family)
MARLAAVALLLLTSAASIGAGGCDSEVEAQAVKPEGPSVTIRDQKVLVEVARTNAEKDRGLGYRESLAWGHGMVFSYRDTPGFPAFWMKGMRFDIDIVWLRDGRIVDISHRVRHSPQGHGDTVRPREVTDMVLEVPAGFAQAHGWRPGDRAELQLEEIGDPDEGPNRSD